IRATRESPTGIEILGVERLPSDNGPEHWFGNTAAGQQLARDYRALVSREGVSVADYLIADGISPDVATRLDAAMDAASQPGPVEDGQPRETGGKGVEEPSGEAARPTMASAVTAAGRAAAFMNAEIDDLRELFGEGELRVIVPDGSIRLRLRFESPGLAPAVSGVDTDDQWLIMLDATASVAAVESGLAREIAAAIARSGGNETRGSVLAAPLSPDTTQASLTSYDHGMIAQLDELLRHSLSTDPPSKDLKQLLDRLVDKLDLRLGTKDVDARRSLLPSLTALKLERGFDAKYDGGAVVNRRYATDALTELAESLLARGVPDPADASVIRIYADDLTMQVFRIETDQDGARVVGLAELLGVDDWVSQDVSLADANTQIEFAGAVAQLQASIQTHPPVSLGPDLLGPSADHQSVTPAGLTVPDLIGLAKFRVAGLLSRATPQIGPAAQRYAALAAELGLLGSGDGPTARRGLLPASDELSLVARYDLEPAAKVWTRQAVEAAAAWADATSVRLPGDRIQVTRAGRVVDVYLSTVAPEAGRDSSARMAPILDNTFVITLTEGAEYDPQALAVDELIAAALDNQVDPSATPNADPAAPAQEQALRRTPTVASAVAAAERAAALLGAQVEDDGDGVFSVTLGDESVLVQLVMGDVAGPDPVSGSLSAGILQLTVDQSSPTGLAEASVARHVAAAIAARAGAVEGQPVLTGVALPADTTRASLTAADHGLIAELDELLTQHRATDAPSASLQERLVEKVESAGLRLGGLTTDASRGLLPPVVAIRLELYFDATYDADLVAARRDASAALDRLAEAMSRSGILDTNDRGLVHLAPADDGSPRSVRIGIDPNGSRVATGTVSIGGVPAETIAVSAADVRAQVDFAGAVAQVSAQADGAPTEPDFLERPSSPRGISRAQTLALLTVADIVGLAKLRMAAALSQANPHVGPAARLHRELATDLGLFGDYFDPLMRRSVLTPAEELDLVTRYDLEPVARVLGRQIVEAAAVRVNAESARVRFSMDRVQITRGDAEITVHIVVDEGASSPHIEVAVDADLSLVVPADLDLDPQAVDIDAQIAAALDRQPPRQTGDEGPRQTGGKGVEGSDSDANPDPDSTPDLSAEIDAALRAEVDRFIASAFPAGTDSRGVLRPGTEADPEVARVGRLAEAAARRIDDGVQRTWNAEHNRVSFERSGRELSVAIFVREPAADGRPSPEPAVMVNSTGSIALVIVSPGANLDALAVALDQAVQQTLGADTAAKTPSDRFDDFVLTAVTESLTTGQDSAVIVQPG
ncbi:MAG: hypothetical protein M3400_04520, partial [Actinomycetota bacterium]|nr:hypothetical protein [Actinomycetota bacterium]